MIKPLRYNAVYLNLTLRGVGTHKIFNIQLLKLENGSIKKCEIY